MQEQENPGAADNDLEVFLEEAWIQAMYLYDSAFSAKIGRQFLELGDGFIIGDGAPDSEENLNKKGEGAVDPFDAIWGWYDGDDWVLNALMAKVVETGNQDEDADVYGLYFTYSGVEDWVFDLYGLFANIENDGAIPEITTSATDIRNIKPYNADIYIVGARIAGSALEGFTYKLEGAYQFGDIDVCYEEIAMPTGVWVDRKGDVDVEAWAIEAGIKYMFDAEYNPWLGFTYVYLSGDDGDDDEYEDFITVFDNRVYGEIADPLVQSNAHIFNLAGGFDVNEDVAISAKYYYLMAAEDEVYCDEDDLGHEVDAFLDYQFIEETTATLAAGFFAPGDAVEKEYGGDDTAWFVRGGVKVEF
jgi:hypothetical protein